MKYIEENIVLESNLVQNVTSYFGATLGRVANRIGGSQFILNGTLYKLLPNEGKNMIHGSHKGFSKFFWKVRKYVQDCPVLT